MNTQILAGTITHNPIAPQRFSYFLPIPSPHLHIYTMAYGVKYVPLVPPGCKSRSEQDKVSTYDRLSKYKMLSKLNNAQAAEAK